MAGDPAVVLPLYNEVRDKSVALAIRIGKTGGKYVRFKLEFENKTNGKKGK